MEKEICLSEWNKIIKEADALGASDIHCKAGACVMFRIHKKIKKQTDARTIENSGIEILLKEMLEKEMFAQLVQKGELEFSCTIFQQRMRVSAFRQNDTWALSMRLIKTSVPQPQELGIPQSVVQLIHKKSGLILITGEAGSGKSTTAASLLKEAASQEEKIILTLEQPIEYSYSDENAMILQREIGQDSMSMQSALQTALRQDADIIFVGELQEGEIPALVLKAAEMGKLVVAQMYTDSVLDTLEQFIAFFAPYQRAQARIQLSHVLAGIISQKLLPKQNGEGLAAAFEVMLANEMICAMISENRIHSILSVVNKSQKEGMKGMDDAIYDLYLRSFIDADTAVLYAYDSKEMRRKVQIFE